MCLLLPLCFGSKVDPRPEARFSEAGCLGVRAEGRIGVGFLDAFEDGVDFLLFLAS